MSATYSETIYLAFTVVVLFVATGVALWTRDYNRTGSAARLITLSKEARSTFRNAKEAGLQARVEKRLAKKLARKDRGTNLRQTP